jgi:signal transduction histidine kinase
LVKEVKKAQKQLDALKKAKEEAEAEAEKARKEAKKAEEEAEKAEEKAQEAQETARQKTSQNLFLQSIISEDLKHVVSLHHHIGISAGTIEQYVKNLSRKISKGEPLTPELVQITLERISYQAKMISSIVKFATKANFNLDSAEIKTDIISFIKEYAINVCAGIIKATDDIDIEFKQQEPGEFILAFKPIEISIIIDNMLSNSRKADAKKFSIVVTNLKKDSVEFAFRDNGKGIPKKNANKIFDLGFTTTDGSGLGLYHVYKTVEEMGGEIKLNADYDKGAEFLLRFKK